MCGRYASTLPAEAIRALFRALNPPPAFTPCWNVAPGRDALVVRRHPETGARHLDLLRWGLVPFWAKEAKIGYSTINARAEEAASKPAYREALKRRRCLVPADAFYEWARPDPKTKRPFAFGLKSGDLYAFAGLWESWRPKEGEPLETFTILTTGPNEIMAPIHNRMPVILEPKGYDRWLDAGDPATPPADLLRPYPAERMTTWPVSARVGNVRNNDPELLKPLV
jgi:putative SOS response-associated peptidase YedK